MYDRVHKESYICDVQKKGLGENLEICHVLPDSVVFKQWLYCSFLQMGITKLVIFCGIINVWAQIYVFLIINGAILRWQFLKKRLPNPGSF